MEQTQDITFESPVLPPAATQMGIDVMVNEKGQVWVAHDKPFEYPVLWIEYDRDVNELNFMMRGGRIQEFGVRINKKMGDVLARGRKAWLVRIVNKKIEDLGEVPLLVRESGIKLWGEA